MRKNGMELEVLDENNLANKKQAATIAAHCRESNRENLKTTMYNACKRVLSTFLGKDATVGLLVRKLESLFEFGKHSKAMLPPLGTKQAGTLFV